MKIKEEAIHSLSIICFHYEALQTEVIYLLLSDIVTWSQEIKEDQIYFQLFDLLQSWILPQTSKIQLSYSQMQSLIMIIQNFTNSEENYCTTTEENRIQKIEQLIFTILSSKNTKKNQQYTSLIDLSSFQNKENGLHFLLKISKIYPNEKILSKNISSLLYHYDQENLSIQLQIISIYENFGKQNENSLPLLFTGFFRFLHHHDSEKILLHSLSSLYEIFHKQDHYLSFLNHSIEFNNCVLKIGEIYLNDNKNINLSNEIYELTEKCINLLIQHDQCFLILFPLVKISLSKTTTTTSKQHENYNYLYRSIQLLVQITETYGKASKFSNEIQEFILHALEFILPNQLLLKDQSILEQIKEKYLQIFKILGSNSMFCSKVFSIFPSVYFITDLNSSIGRLNHDENNNNNNNNNNSYDTLPLFVFMILDQFVSASTVQYISSSSCNFGISIILIQKLLLFWLYNNSKYSFLFDIIYNIMSHVNDFKSPAIIFLQNQWISLLNIQKYSILLLLHKLVINNIELIDDSLYEFTSIIIQWFNKNYLSQLKSSINEEKKQQEQEQQQQQQQAEGDHLVEIIQKEENDYSIQRLSGLITKLVNKLFENENSWKILLPSVCDLIGQSDAATTWVIENPFLNVSSVLNHSKICQIFIECLGVNRLLSIINFLNEMPQIQSLLKNLQINTKQITQNVLDENNSIEKYEEILSQLINNETSVNHHNYNDLIILEKSKLILWVLSNLNSIYLLGKFSNLSFLSKISCILSIDCFDSLYEFSLLSFSNILQKIPTILSEIPDDFFNMKKLVDILQNNHDLIPSICRLIFQLFYDPRFQKAFIDADGLYQLSRTMSELSSHIQNSNIARESLVESLKILVFASRIPNLRIEIIGDGLIPVVLNLLNLTRVESIISNVLDFINFMSYENMARKELIDSRDIDSLSAIIDQSETYPELSKSALECFVRLGGW